MNLLKNEAIQVNREGSGGDYVDGHRVSAADDTFKGEGSIQPLNGKEILQLPESDRVRQAVKIYTSLSMEVNDKMIRISDNAEFEVHSVENWGVFNMLQHYKVTALLKDVQ